MLYHKNGTIKLKGKMLLLFLYLFNLYIRPQDWMPFFYAWPVDYLILIPALIVGFISSASDEKKTIRLPQYALLMLLLLITLLSNAIHGNFGFGIDQFTIFLKKTCIFIVILLLIKSTSRLKTILFLIIILSAIIAGQAIAQFQSGGAGMAGQDFYHSGEGVRTTWVGLWDGANSTALLLNIALPFALEFAFGQYSVLWRLANIILAGVLMGGVYTTNSRGGFVTLLAILAIYPMFRLKSKKIAIAIGVMLTLGALVYMSPSRAGQMDTKEESAQIRTRLWGNAMDMFKENKLFGVGKGKFKEENGRHMMAHSNFMQNLGEMGGVGIFVWMAFIYLSFKSLILAYWIKAPAGASVVKIKSLARAVFVSMIGFNVCTLFITMETEGLYLLLGLCAAVVNVANREIAPINMKFTRKDFIGISASVVGILLFYHIYTR